MQLNGLRGPGAMQSGDRPAITALPGPTKLSFLGSSRSKPDVVTRSTRVPENSVQAAQCDDGQEMGGLSRRVVLISVAAGMGAAAQPGLAEASSSEAVGEVQKAYDSYAATYDGLDDGSLAELAGFPELREEQLAKVVRVAVGTGLNLAYYNYDAVESLTALDLSQGMLDEASKRAAAKLPSRPVKFVQGDAAALPFDSASFDTVTDTFSLCVFSEPLEALKEMARVVKPSSEGGRVLLVEHSRSGNPLLGAYQVSTGA
eukprot:gene12750-16000_t